MEFGIPKTRVKKEEKYENIGVITLRAVEKEGGSRRIEFNKKALELLNMTLGVNSKFSFSFSNNIIYIVNTFSNPNIAGLSLGKITPSVSNKKYYEYIRNLINNADTPDDYSKDIELVLEETERTYQNEKVFILKKLEIDDEDTVSSEEKYEDLKKNTLGEVLEQYTHTTDNQDPNEYPEQDPNEYPEEELLEYYNSIEPGL